MEFLGAESLGVLEVAAGVSGFRRSGEGGPRCV